MTPSFINRQSVATSFRNNLDLCIFQNYFCSCVSQLVYNVPGYTSLWHWDIITDMLKFFEKVKVSKHQRTAYEYFELYSVSNLASIDPVFVGLFFLNSIQQFSFLFSSSIMVLQSLFFLNYPSLIWYLFVLSKTSIRNFCPPDRFNW